MSLWGVLIVRCSDPNNAQVTGVAVLYTAVKAAWGSRGEQDRPG